jgi:hypothetical protein
MGEPGGGVDSRLPAFDALASVSASRAIARQGLASNAAQLTPHSDRKSPITVAHRQAPPSRWHALPVARHRA